MIRDGFWVGGLHQWLAEARVETEAAWEAAAAASSLLLLPGACLRRPPCCRPAPPPCGSATARRTGGSWPGWCPDTSSSPGSSASSSRYSSILTSIHSTSTRIFPTQQAAKPFSAAGPDLGTRAWEQQRLQRRVVVRDRQPAGRPSSKSTNTADDHQVTTTVKRRAAAAKKEKKRWTNQLQ